jgi:hypothetical protein
MVPVYVVRLTALALVLTSTACGAADSTQTRPAGAVTRAPAVGTIVTTLGVADQAVSMASDGRYLWVGGASGQVTQVDTTISQVIRTVRLPGRPVGVAVTPEGVWFADNAGSTVTRLDAGTGLVTATVRVAANPLGFAQSDRELWVFSQSQQVANVIDPARARVVRTVSTPGLGAGYPSVAGNAIWAPDLAGTTRSLWRIDPDTGLSTRRIATGTHPAEVAFGFGSGWVTDEDGVIRFDPATGREQARITDIGRQLDGVVVTAGAVWAVSIADDQLTRIDAGSNKPSGSLGVCTGPRHLTVAQGDIWIACFDAGMLVRLHPN